MTTIAVDAMGGDHAPKSEVEGAIRAATAFEVKIILVGLEDVIRQELSQHPTAGRLPIQVRHASEVISMEDSAAKAVRRKKDSSIHCVAARLRIGKASLKGWYRRATPERSWPRLRWFRE